MQKCFFSKYSRVSAKCFLILLTFATAFLLSGCAEAIIGCKDGDPLLFFSPVRDFACPEEPTDAVDDVQIAPTEGNSDEVVLEWNNPTQIDLRAIEVSWTALSDSIAEPRAITSPEGAIDAAATTTGIVRIPNARPNERMRQSFTVQEGLAYRFRVAGVDRNDNVSLVQQTHYVPAPIDVRAELQEGNASVVVTWKAIYGVTGYYIYRSLGSDSAPNRLDSLITNTKYEGDSVFTYRVRAVISNGDGTSIESGNSDAVHASAPVAAPTSLTAKSSDGSVRLVWTAPTGGGTVTEYRIYRVAGTDIDDATRLATNPTILPPSFTTYTDRTATNGAEYRYVVRAVNSSDTESANSNTVTATPLAAPGAPTNFTATPGNDTVRLEWEAPASSDSSVSGYRIYRALGTRINGAVLLPTAPPTLPPTTLSYTDTSVTNNVQYTYTVRAVNAHDTESASSESRSATPRQPAGAPASLAAASLDGSVRLTWTAPAAGGGAVAEYRIYRVAGTDIDDATRLTTNPAVISTITTTYTDSTATNDTEYRYVVRAVNANNVESANSDAVTATPLATPGAPASLSISARSGEVTLSWTMPTSSDSAVSGYRIYRAVGATLGASPRLISGQTPLSDTTFSYTDNNVRNGAEYAYAVRATNSNGLESENSDIKSITPLAPAGAPTSLTARFGDGSARLTWTAPADGANVDGYHVYRVAGTDINNATRLTTPQLSSRMFTYTDTTVANGTEYSYVVRAVNTLSAESRDSPVRTGRPLAPPSQPATLTAKAGSGSVTLTWTAPTTNANEVLEYRVYRAMGNTITDTPDRLASAITLAPTTRAYTDSTTTNGTEYTYTVRAVNVNGTESVNSDTVTATPLTLPNRPATLTAEVESGSVTLTWTVPVGGPPVHGYQIYRATSFDISQAAVLSTTLSASARTYTDSTAVNGNQYSYVVRAVNENDTESFNSPVAFATPLALPDAPPSFTATAGNGVVTLNWDASTGGGAVILYRIYRVAGANINSATRPLATTSRIVTTYTDSTAVNGTEYTYAVRAVNANNAESGNSAPQNATPLALPNRPTNLMTKAEDGQVVLSWAAPATGGPVDEYYIYRVVGTNINHATRIATTPVTPTTYIDTSVVNGIPYTYAVRAVNANKAESGNSIPQSATPLATPNPPTALTAADGDTSVTLRWTAPARGSAVTQYHIYRATGTDISSATRLMNTRPATITGTTYTDSGLTNGSDYTYAVRAVNANDTESVNSTPVSAKPRLVPYNIMVRDGGAQVALSWSAPLGASGYYIHRTVGAGSEARLATTPTILTTNTYTDRDVTIGTTYHYRIQAVSDGVGGEFSARHSITLSVDFDNNKLIDIRNLDMLDHIRYNLSGTSYKTSAGAAGLQCGAASDTVCAGYELLRDLDFAVASSYASGSVNTAWRPTGGTPGSATNGGWQPIGDGTTPFATLFEGNGNKISNLYSRNAVNTSGKRTGLFGQLGSATLRNLLIADSNVYGGSSQDHIGIAVGYNNGGTISNVAVRGGSARSGDGSDYVGGLVGRSESTIVASSASSTAVYGDGGNGDFVGGLVGWVGGGTVTASYATGDVHGGTGNAGSAGGLVGTQNGGTIRASYALGNVSDNNGNTDSVGGLVGFVGSGTVIASYATGNVNDGAGTGDRVGKLIGTTSGTSTASYGFGTLSGGETAGYDGSALPSDVTTVSELTEPGSATSTAAPAEWQDASSHTRYAWNFGTNSQTPALRYADYDSVGSGSDYCASFSSRVPGTTDELICGTTFLPGQNRAAASRSPFDLTVSIHSDSVVLRNTAFTLKATVANPQGAQSAPIATLTYYRSTDDTRSIATDTFLGTDAISALRAGVTDTQEITIPPTTAGTYYYYACVRASTNETDTSNNCSDITITESIPPVDSDNDRLIDIRNLDMLDHIRYNLAGSSYRGNATDSGIRCGADNATDCIGYELMRNLDFAVAGSYASGSVNMMAWRPTGGNSGSATNSGWQPIGNNPTPFATLFEGNGYTVSNLYSRNAANTSQGRTGLFGQISASGTLRNLLIADSNVYGGNNSDTIGIAAGRNSGTISNVAVSGGSAHGGNLSDSVGGLVGWNNGAIIASSASRTAVYGDGGFRDAVGGLVGVLRESSTVTASYASGTVDGGTGDFDSVGGLVGTQIGGTIRASYATGNVSANAGTNENAGGIVGQQIGSATIIASYATGNVDGGAGAGDGVGTVRGNTAGTVTASYGFGTTSGGEATGNNGSTRPSGVTMARQFTAPGSAATTAAPAQWNQTGSHSLNAWNFGTGTQAPALRYADYDGTGGTDYCASFTNVPGTSTAIVCGTTLLPNQR